MEQLYAEILAAHAAEAIKSVSDLRPLKTEVHAGRPASEVRELAVFIDFQGNTADGRKVAGYVGCGETTAAEARPLLLAIIRHLHLSDGLLDSDDGPINVLSEFLNIVVGLAGADWAERGFNIDFSPPRLMNGQSPAGPTPDASVYHILIELDHQARVELLVVFHG